MAFFRYARVERVIATWSIEADTLEQAIIKWRAESNGKVVTGITLEGEEVTEVDDDWWQDEHGDSLTDRAIEIIEALDEVSNKMDNVQQSPTPNTITVPNTPYVAKFWDDFEGEGAPPNDTWQENHGHVALQRFTRQWDEAKADADDGLGYARAELWKGSKLINSLERQH